VGLQKYSPADMIHWRSHIIRTNFDGCIAHNLSPPPGHNTYIGHLSLRQERIS
jgi:hypothetical protein